MTKDGRLRLAEVECRVRDLASEQLGMPRHRIAPSDRLIEDLKCDSLHLVELFMKVEEAFGITLDEKSPNPVYKAVFTRQPFRLSDLAELVYLQQGTGTPDRRSWRQPRQEATPTSSLPFTQLHGRWEVLGPAQQRLFEPLKTKGTVEQYRRRSEGMRCLLIACHYPPGTSKWNKIEHRLFSHITMNWRGRPLVSYQVIVNLIGATTTQAGLRVQADLDTDVYPTKVKVTDKKLFQK